MLARTAEVLKNFQAGRSRRCSAVRPASLGAIRCVPEATPSPIDRVTIRPLVMAFDAADATACRTHRAGADGRLAAARAVGARAAWMARRQPAPTTRGSPRPAVPTRWSRPCSALPGRGRLRRPFPEGLDPRMRARARDKRDHAALHASGTGHRARPRRPERGRHHANRFGQDALLQRAGARRDAALIRRHERSICFQPRRWHRISSPSCTVCASSSRVRRRSIVACSIRRTISLGRISLEAVGVRRIRLHRTNLCGTRLCRIRRGWATTGLTLRVRPSACSPTTVTRRRTRGAPSARARTSSSATRTCSMRASCRITHAGRSCSRTCSYVVIDELHAYRGVFGSHLANILRRLHRVCRHYGSSPVFICTSATIANPVELAERLTERPIALVAESGAPRAEKFFVFVNPPVVNRAAGDPPLVPLGVAPRRARVPEAQPAAHRVRAEPPGHRDPDDLPEGGLPGSARGRPSSCAAIAAATCRCGGARSSAGCATGACARWCRRARSSSASTSARSTSR